MKVAVIGAGTMGAGIAQTFAQAETVDTVYLCDIYSLILSENNYLHFPGVTMDSYTSQLSDFFGVVYQ